MLDDICKFMRILKFCISALVRWTRLLSEFELEQEGVW